MLVNTFHQIHISTHSYSIFKEAMQYADEKNLEMSCENEKYKRILPPLSLLSESQQKEMMSKLKELEFLPEKNIAA